MLEIKIKKTLPDFHLAIDLTVDREIVSILGPSGSGKTMTLLSIAGLIRPDEGSIRLNERTLFSSAEGVFLPPQKRKIGFVFQNYALFPHLTVAENIAYGMHGKPKKDIQKRVAELLELINIPGLKMRYPGELSSGQQQRVALARAIAPEPEALLLDEPFSALDTFRRERLEYELLALHQYFKGDILFITHDLAQGFKIGTRMAIYENGRIVQCESREKVINSPVNRTAAKLTGVKNLFDGYIASIENGAVQAYIPEFGKPLKINYPETLNLSLNQPVIIGIRPEHIEIMDYTQENTIPSRVSRLVDGVTDLHYYYFADKDIGKRYNLESCTSRPLSPPNLDTGKSCFLYFPPDRLIVLTE